MTRHLQPPALQHANAQREQLTFRRVELALTDLAELQKKLPAKQHSYSDEAIVAADRARHPERPPLTTATLRNNHAAAHLIAQFRQMETTEVKFERFGTWKPPKYSSHRSYYRRQAKYKLWKIPSLAEEIVGVRDLIRHMTERRQAIELAHWTTGPWPTTHRYPLQPYIPCTTLSNQARALARAKWKDKLIRELLTVEIEASGLYQSLLEYDERYCMQEAIQVHQEPEQKNPHGSD